MKFPKIFISYKVLELITTRHLAAGHEIPEGYLVTVLPNSTYKYVNSEWVIQLTEKKENTQKKNSKNIGTFKKYFTKNK